MTALNGKYELERQLGSGGMAEVFLARTIGAEGFSRQVAIKRVLPGFSENPAFASMFISEAQLSSRLQHPNVVSVLDFDRDTEGRLFLVMEAVNGTDLDGLLTTGPLDFSTVVFIAIEILQGLDHAHDLPIGNDGVRGLVHRDISPHNVLLSWDGAVKVSDFGIAKARAATSASASMVVKGKPAWMSPEQARGDKLDGRSDLFAVGIMLFEMICHRRLFLADTTEATLANVWFAPIPPVREARPETPADLAKVVDWLLRRELDQRTPNAAVAIAALEACNAYPRTGRKDLVKLLAERFAGRAPVRAGSVVRSSPVAPTMAALPRQTRTATPPPGMRQRRARSWVWLAWLAVATVALGGAVVGLQRMAKGSAATASPTVAPAAETSTVAPVDASAALSAPEHRTAGASSGSMEAAAGGGSAPSPAPGEPVPPARVKPPATPPSHRSVPARPPESGIRVVPLDR